MSFFYQPRPKEFHLEPMFINKRKDRLKAIEERAKQELEGEQTKEEYHYNSEHLRGSFLKANKHLRRYREKKLLGSMVLNFGVILILIVFLISIWRMLLSI